MGGVARVCLANTINFSHYHSLLYAYVHTLLVMPKFAQKSMSVLRAPTTVTTSVLTLLAPSPALVTLAINC